jgi:hypothetical protein
MFALGTSVYSVGLYGRPRRGGADDLRDLAGGAGEVGGDDVGGVAVEGASSAVVAHGGARVGVGGGFLNVA